MGCSVVKPTWRSKRHILQDDWASGQFGAPRAAAVNSRALELDTTNSLASATDGRQIGQSARLWTSDAYPSPTFSNTGWGQSRRSAEKQGEEWPTTRPEPGLAGESLFDALPQKLVRRILPVNHSSFPVLPGDKEKAIIALKFEPSNIVDAAPIWWACVFQVVGDGLRL